MRMNILSSARTSGYSIQMGLIHYNGLNNSILYGKLD
jgi:hypothetical protein